MFIGIWFNGYHQEYTAIGDSIEEVIANINVMSDGDSKDSIDSIRFFQGVELIVSKTVSYTVTEKQK